MLPLSVLALNTVQAQHATHATYIGTWAYPSTKERSDIIEIYEGDTALHVRVIRAYKRARGRTYNTSYVSGTLYIHQKGQRDPLFLDPAGKLVYGELRFTKVSDSTGLGKRCYD